MDASPEDDTEVPREARLLCDPQGKLVFIGDCAPLSLFQSVRQIVTRYVGPDAFAPETSRYSVLENASGETSTSSSSLPISSSSQPEVRPVDVSRAVSNYTIVTAGLVDLFDEARVTDDIILWANLEQKPHNLTSAINYLILAIGRHRDDEAGAQVYFEHARDHAWRSLSGNLGVGTSQAFLLITLYMLCSSQINSAFLVFGVAVRAAHSIGVHRTEVNARFGQEIHRQRDRLWKSLRVVDLFLSTSMGRPPSTSDVDCTVPYRSLDDKGEEEFDLLNASVQILLILETIVLEIYSRKKISLQLTEGVSHQLREWSSQWLHRLKDVLAQPTDANSQTSATAIANMRGACQVLSTYYYAVMLVSRPFLMYELCRRLSDAPPTTSLSRRPSTLISGKSKLADACIDAASLMVDPILDLIDRGVLVGRMPVLVYGNPFSSDCPVPLLTHNLTRSWLFAASLVLGVGLLGGFGRILDRYTRMSIRALDYFAKSDTHAHQYSLIAQSLLDTAIDNLERRELQERLRRTESSSQLFGLLPPHGMLRASVGHHGSPVSSSPAVSATAPLRDESSMRVATHDAGHILSPAATTGTRRRESLDRPYIPQQQAQHHQHGIYNHHQQHYPQPHPHHHPMLQASSAQSPRFGDIDSAFLGLTDSMMPTPDGNFWAPYMGTEGDQGSTLNLFPLLEAGGGIDLANYL